MKWIVGVMLKESLKRPKRNRTYITREYYEHVVMYLQLCNNMGRFYFMYEFD